MTRAKLLDRDGLIHVARDYLAAVCRRDPSCLALDPGFRATENGKDIDLTSGYWSTLERFAGELFFADPETQQTAVMGVAYRDGQPWPFALRLRIRDSKISEAEAILSTDGNGPFADVQQLLKADLLYQAPVPAGRAADRDELERSADSYWEGLQQSDGSIPAFHYRCDKYDNGAKTTNSLMTLLSPDKTVHSCASGLNNTKPARPISRNRRYPVLDTALSVAVSFVVVDFHPIPDSPRPDAGSFYMMGVFKVVDGQLRIIDEIREILPFGSESGW